MSRIFILTFDRKVDSSEVTGKRRENKKPKQLPGNQTRDITVHQHNKTTGAWNLSGIRSHETILDT